MALTTQPGREQLLLDPATRVTCPRCEHEFSLEEGFARKSLEAIEEASHGALAELREQARALEEKRARERAAQAEELLQEQIRSQQALLEAQRKQSAEALDEMRRLEKEAAATRESALQERLREQEGQVVAAMQEREALAQKERILAEQEAGLAERIEREAAARALAIADQSKLELEGRLEAQAQQIAAFQATELQLRRERQELEARQQQFELDVQRRLDEERRRIEESVRSAETEKARFREADLQKKLEDTLGKLADAQRQLEQGSQQAQGEVLELLLEKELAETFPVDRIAEVKKGVRGGDAVHTVVAHSGQAAGFILWEAKRAQRWSGQWPSKLKEDMREAGAEIGVIVTTAFPAEWPAGQSFGLHEEVWLTSPATALPLAAALRAGLLDAYKARVANANKGEKMEAVYDYLTSPQFAHKLRAVYEAFRKMKQELDVERTTMQQRWRRREKQIQTAQLQLIGIAGDLQGLAQQDLPQLELEPEALAAPEDEAGQDAPADQDE